MMGKASICSCLSPLCAYCGSVRRWNMYKEASEQMEVKDSGKRQQFDSGMVRDVTDDKTDYTLVLDGPMFERWATHLTKGAKKYSKRNWMKAKGLVEYFRFKESALRHFLQWFWGKRDEDHAAATIFNINGAEYVRERMVADGEPEPSGLAFPID